MRWNLRMVAAQRGIWRASDLRRALAKAGLELSAGKMSHLWSQTPISVRLDDLDVICAVLECTPVDLLIPDPPIAEPASAAQASALSAEDTVSTIRPTRSRGRRSAPPV
jgi:DNA-binding Xre family transcriptional regulator